MTGNTAILVALCAMACTGSEPGGSKPAAPGRTVDRLTTDERPGPGLPAEPRTAAAAGLPVFLGKIPPGMEPSYGFVDRAQLDRASLGAPYELWALDPRRLDGPASEVLVASDEWRFPLLCDGEMRSLLTVARKDGRWTAVDFGGAALAEEVGRLERGQTATGPLLRRALVRLHQLRADVLALAPGGARLEDATFFPLRSARAALELGDAPSVTLPNLLAAVRERYRVRPPESPR